QPRLVFLRAVCGRVHRVVGTVVLRPHLRLRRADATARSDRAGAVPLRRAAAHRAPCREDQIRAARLRPVVLPCYERYVDLSLRRAILDVYRKSAGRLVDRPRRAAGCDDLREKSLLPVSLPARSRAGAALETDRLRHQTM